MAVPPWTSKCAMSPGPLVARTIIQSVAGTIMAAVNTQAVACRILSSSSGNNATPEKMSLIPFILPKGKSAGLERGMPKPSAPADGYARNLAPIKIMPPAITIVIHQDAERIPHCLFVAVVFIYCLFYSTNLNSPKPLFMHLG